MNELELEYVVQIIQKKEKPIVIAIDGRCASGKTTFGTELAKKLDSNIIYMDNFFLQKYQRTPKRYATPGENVDHERVKQVIASWKNKQILRYQKFDCQKMELTEFIEQEWKPILIVEGSYSMHEDLLSYYDMKLFFTVNYEERLERILKRNGPEKQKVFIEKWIPLEEKYFNAFSIAEKADIIIDTSTEEIHA